MKNLVRQANAICSLNYFYYKLLLLNQMMLCFSSI